MILKKRPALPEKMGPIAYGSKQEELFLGREVTKHQEFSENTSQEIDAEVKIIVMEAMARAENILVENMDVLHRLSKELLEREILDADEINKIINGEELPPLKKISDEIPDHVKEMIKEKETRKEDTTKIDKTSESNDNNA